MFKSNFQKNKSRKFFSTLALFVCVSFIFLIARTDKVNAITGVPGEQTCMEGICGRMTNTCSDVQSNGLSYDLEIDQVTLDSLAFHKLSYHLCLNPRQNKTQESMYAFLGTPQYIGPIPTPGGLPDWACYLIGPAVTQPSPELTFSRTLNSTNTNAKINGKFLSEISNFIVNNTTRPIGNDSKFPC